MGISVKAGPLFLIDYELLFYLNKSLIQSIMLPNIAKINKPIDIIPNMETTRIPKENPGIRSSII
jgi:hypothetical protein